MEEPAFMHKEGRGRWDRGVSERNRDEETGSMR